MHADVGIKKGEKVNYAILRDGKPVILVECKQHTADLGKVHASQLYRYFSVTDARFGILTNGIVYWFYTDLEAPNKMDSKPFFAFNMLEYKESTVEELKKFTKAAFDVTAILTTATELKYTREITRLLSDQLQAPTDEFVRLFTAQLSTGRMTGAIREQFAQLTKQAFRQLINDQVNDRLKTALGSDPTISPVIEAAPPAPAPAPVSETPVATNGAAIVTTEEELEAYHIIRAIVREQVNVTRIVLRDVQSYCGILLDDNNRKPICRLRFNGAQKFLGLFTGAADGKDGQAQERVLLPSLDAIFQHADALKATVARYDAKVAK